MATVYQTVDLPQVPPQKKYWEYEPRISQWCGCLYKEMNSLTVEDKKVIIDKDFSYLCCFGHYLHAEIPIKAITSIKFGNPWTQFYIYALYFIVVLGLGITFAAGWWGFLVAFILLVGLSFFNALRPYMIMLSVKGELDFDATCMPLWNKAMSQEIESMIRGKQN